jgi:hypothetical protein
MKAEDLEKATALGRDCGGELCRQTDGFARVFPAGRGTSCIQLTLSLKAPGFNPCAYEVETWFQTFAFQVELVPLHPGAQVHRGGAAAAGVSRGHDGRRSERRPGGAVQVDFSLPIA